MSITDIQFRDESGIPFPSPFNPGGLEIGDAIPGEIWVKFGGSTSNAYNLYAQFDVFINGVKDGSTRTLCLFGGVNVPNQDGLFHYISDFTWEYGDKLEIKNIYMTWTTGNAGDGDCKPKLQNSQCYYSPTGLVVNTPLVANFNFTTNCDDFEVDFQNLTTGGDPATTATYSWDFGDGGSSTATAPSHTYATAGTYSVTLTATKSGIVKSLMKSVIIYPLLNASGDVEDDDCSETATGSIDLTVSGGNGSYTFEWSTLDGSGLTPDVEDQTGLSTGTYSVAITDGKNCSVIKEFTIVKPAQAPAPPSASFEYCNGSGMHLISISPTPGYTLVWYDQTGTTVLPGAPSVDGATPGLFTYKVSQTKDGECESAQSTVTVEIKNCAISITKTGELLGEGECTEDGDNILYTFTVTNTGGVTLNNINLTELEFSGSGSLPTLSFVSASPGSNSSSLLPGGVAIFTATYSVSLQDIAAGKVENRAKISATGLGGYALEQDSSPFSLTGLFGLESFKNWNLVVQNNYTVLSGSVSASTLVGGNLILNNAVNFSENAVSAGNGAGLMVGGNISGSTINLNSGGNLILQTGSTNGASSINYNGGGSFSNDPNVLSYVGDLFNRAVVGSSYLGSLAANGSVSGGNMTATPTLIDGKNVAVYEISGISGSDLNLNFGSADLVVINVSGANINYNAPPNLTGAFNTNSSKIIWNFKEATTLTINNNFRGVVLAPFAALNLSGGEIYGTVVVKSLTTQGAIRQPIYSGITEEEVSEESGLTVVELCQNASLTISKDVDQAEISAPTTLNYTITVTNTGNVDLTNVVVTDDLAGTATLESGDDVDSGVLNVSEVWIFTAAYEATQSDINAGEILINTVKITTDQTAEQEDTAETEIAQEISVDITKEADVTSVSDAGQVITYTYTVTNTGKVTLTGLAVEDDKLGGIAVDQTTLAPGATTSGTAAYTVEQSDIDANQDIVNVATVSSSEEATDTATETVGIAQEISVDITK
ncbi:DUF7507 domain-containing protein, partial [Algoriphagus terrigena]|uniref:DUF7507 domain-containing protein n=1 Tax=Algoriphagus terrigena TaxID=344884 RepID=UPI00146FA171